MITLITAYYGNDYGVEPPPWPVLRLLRIKPRAHARTKQNHNPIQHTRAHIHNRNNRNISNNLGFIRNHCRNKPAQSVINQEKRPTVEKTPPQIHTITSKDGREINITDDQTAYQHLADQGKIVFTTKEIAYVKATKATPEQASIFLDTKQLWPAATITKGATE